MLTRTLGLVDPVSVFPQLVKKRVNTDRTKVIKYFCMALLEIDFNYGYYFMFLIKIQGEIPLKSIREVSRVGSLGLGILILVVKCLFSLNQAHDRVASR